MKKVILFLLCIQCSCMIMIAQQVPDSVSQKFKTAYPNASNPQWQWENDNYRVNYWDEKSVEHNIMYDKTGKMIKAQHQIGPDQIPTGISEYYRKNYPDELDYKVWMEDDGMGSSTYYVPGKNEVMWFDSEGNYTKRSPVMKNRGKPKKTESDENKNKKEPKTNSGTKKNNPKTNVTKPDNKKMRPETN